MKTWVTSDLHFGHVRIRELAHRPFGSVEEMDQTLVDNINDVVGSERLIILGDVCMGKLADSLEVLGKLKAAEVIILPGNHDRWSLAYQHRGDESAKRHEFRLQYEKALGGRGVAFQDWTPSAWEGLFSLTGEWEHIGSPLNAALFSHYPYVGDSHGDGEDRYGWLRPKDEGKPLIHGHVHEEWKIRDNMFNVGVDANEFLPVSQEVLEEWVTSLSE